MNLRNASIFTVQTQEVTQQNDAWWRLQKAQGSRGGCLFAAGNTEESRTWMLGVLHASTRGWTTDCLSLERGRTWSCSEDLVAAPLTQWQISTS